MHLFIAERFVVAVTSILYLIDITLIIHKGVQVDFIGYGFSMMTGVALLLMGQLYRGLKRSPNLATALISAGLFILFSISASGFNYMFLPVQYATIDHALMQVDAWVGYEWSSFVSWAAMYPLIGKALFIVYATSLPQLLAIVITLGFTGKSRKLHHFLVTGILGALASIAVWIFFPTHGAKAYQDLPVWVMQAIPLAVDPAYGQDLIRLGREGVSYLSPSNVLGLIGFPSFHIFMAAMSVWFVPRYTFAIVAAWGLNLLMVPATLVQGGHHLSDVFGGLILFAIICPLSSKLLDWMARVEEGQATPAPNPAV
ncbi:phosphatase PAP2 family protein [Agrobacterium larrymoorei]|uniref:Phosphatase PAP2 family protein n=1 Tax=Agrobacterium larrymoorei TaxID=160699 RepID=A0AAF0H555_9HYPH|nr:phosphatase PAP2 family protein [Agrobacterium larrymoorei]WHA39931.1 phosphatase PAP2 family protein [Agrobacterium larrymoorei]